MPTGVYEFTAAARHTSGSQSPASSFALAPGNTNPQGIADPPPPADAQLATPAVVNNNWSVKTDSSALATALVTGSVVSDTKADAGVGDGNKVAASDQRQPDRAVVLASVLQGMGVTHDEGTTSKKLAAKSDTNQAAFEAAVDGLFAEEGGLLLRLL